MTKLTCSPCNPGLWALTSSFRTDWKLVAPSRGQTIKRHLCDVGGQAVLLKGWSESGQSQQIDVYPSSGWGPCGSQSLWAAVILEGQIQYSCWNWGGGGYLLFCISSPLCVIGSSTCCSFLSNTLCLTGTQPALLFSNIAIVFLVGSQHLLTVFQRIIKLKGMLD